MLKSILLVGAGGFAGSVLRFLISRHTGIQATTAFPIGTFTVNILGCLLIGVIYGLTIKNAVPSEVRLLLITGFCGGFTTFSSFSSEFLMLLRSDHTRLAFVYALGSMAIGVAAVWMGLSIVKNV